ncbi:hypothetical protein C8J57DRAFT_1170078 [Mycena rebaudengoi]|nr:hypothetical protein C8J57DRAFT_1170078 [Mycena rebaudengoi]
MEQFSEEHAKTLLNKEWLAKNSDSTPYFFKCYFSTVDLSCFILLTDTKSVWTEVLNGKQFARRWRSCNPTAAAADSLEEEDEEEWRIYNLELLAKSHTLGGVTELSFDCVESNYADLAAELECEAFKWRWEMCLQGRQFSAEIISRHLVQPLISLNHLAFTTDSAVGELSETDLEKAVDKVGRTARRAADTHLKNALAKPRVATSLRRMTAIFSFATDLPPILVNAEKPELQAHVRVSKSPEVVAYPSETQGEHARSQQELPLKERSPPHKIPVTTDSATESEEDDPPVAVVKGKGRALPSPASPSAKTEHLSPATRAISPSPIPSTAPSKLKAPSSDSDSSSHRPPAKKAKLPVSSSDDDSEAERKRRLAKATGGAGGAKRGTRQPIKRGGKRF